MRIIVKTEELKGLLGNQATLGPSPDLVQYVQFKVSLPFSRAGRTISYVNVRQHDYDVVEAEKDIYQQLTSLKFDWIGISLANNNKLTFVFGATQSAIYFETEAAKDMFLIKAGDVACELGDYRSLL